MMNKFKPEMSTECQEQLTRRQKINVQDVQTDKAFTRACKKDLIANNCNQIKAGSGMNVDSRLATMLLCLESAMKEGVEVRAECKAELLDHRRMLMQDYKLSPNILKYCSQEIGNFCNDGIERNGKTLHCLFRAAKASKLKSANLNALTKTSVRPECFIEVGQYSCYN